MTGKRKRTSFRGQSSQSIVYLQEFNFFYVNLLLEDALEVRLDGLGLLAGELVEVVGNVVLADLGGLVDGGKDAKSIN